MRPPKFGVALFHRSFIGDRVRLHVFDRRRVPLAIVHVQQRIRREVIEQHRVGASDQPCQQRPPFLHAAVVVQQRLADENNVRLQGDALEAKGEALENLCEQITDYLVGLKLTVGGINGAPTFKKVDANPAYNISALYELGTFDSAQFLTCKAWKAVS